MKTVVVSILLISLSTFGKESITVSFSDTIKPKSDQPNSNYKLNRKQFIESYGHNDSTKALIHYFYDKRNNKNYLFFPTVMSVGIISNYIEASLNPIAFTLLLILFGLAIFYSIYRLMKWGILLLIYNRKKLLALTVQLENDQPIPLNIWRNVVRYKSKKFTITGKEKPSKLERKQRRLN